MNRTYELVKLAKVNQGIESDNAFAIRNGLQRGHINNWKSGRSRPDIDNLYVLAHAAGISLDEAYEIIREKNETKQAGFISLPVLLGMGLVSSGAMTLAAMSPLPYEALMAGFIGGNIVYYVKLTIHRLIRTFWIYRAGR